MLPIADRIACLRETELFSGVPADDLKRIAEVAQDVRYADGGTVFQDGEKGDSVYFVVEGEVKAHKSGVELRRIRKNECVGEMGVIDEGPRSLSVSAVGDVLLLKLARDDFYHVAEGNAKLFQNVLKIVLRKLRGDTERQIEVISERERLMQDMVRAREMQMNMLPTQDLCVEMDNGLYLRASGHCRPAERVGGDYYDYFCLPDDQVGLVIGDVEGHRFHTGLMVATARSCLHTQIKSDYSVPSVMSAMSNMVYEFVHGDLRMTFCYMILDLKDQTLSFSNAGHFYPYHYRADTKQLEMLESNALLLGIWEYQCFETSRSEWGEDDIFVLYTDGIIEAQSRDGELFGDERLKQMVLENAQLPPAEMKNTILQELDSFCQGVTQADDVSLVIVKMGV